MADDLVSRLMRIQDAHGWTDEEMARQSGLTRPMWSTVKSRQTRLGHRSLGSILRAFPELERDVVAYLRAGEEDLAPAV